MPNRSRSSKSAVTGSAIISALLLALFSTSVASAQILVAPTALSFKVPQYVTSAAKSVAVTNTGTAPIVLGQISFAGADAGDFAATKDSCSLHTIAPFKKCTVSIAFSASAPKGTTETATVSINDSSGASLQTVALTGVVSGPVTATLSGLTVTITNATKNYYSMDFSISGPYSNTGTGTCTDVVFPKSACTIVIQQDSPGAGQIKITMAPLSGGKSYVFDIPLS
jgi:P pilus assembly chaperone PapD